MRTFRVYAPELINSGNKTIENAEPIYGETAEFIKYIEIKAHDIGDQYHTMHELYQHRMALTAALFNMMAVTRKNFEIFFDKEKIGPKFVPPLVIKSKLHHDGTMFEGGYFIVMAITNLGQISYHYNLKHWDEFKIPEVERTPEYDGHTALDVMERLRKL